MHRVNFDLRSASLQKKLKKSLKLQLRLIWLINRNISWSTESSSFLASMSPFRQHISGKMKSISLTLCSIEVGCLPVAHFSLCLAKDVIDHSEVVPGWPMGCFESTFIFPSVASCLSLGGDKNLRALACQVEHRLVMWYKRSVCSALEELFNYSSSGQRIFDCLCRETTYGFGREAKTQWSVLQFRSACI